MKRCFAVALSFAMMSISSYAFAGGQVDQDVLGCFIDCVGLGHGTGTCIYVCQG